MNPIKRLILGDKGIERGSRGSREGRRRPCRLRDCPAESVFSEDRRGAGGVCNPPPRAESREGYDRGNERYVLNLMNSADKNPDFRRALWTGEELQLTVMNIPVGSEIGEEIHEDSEQIIKVTDGLGEVYFADKDGAMVPVARVTPEFAVIIPKGERHNLKNIGNKPLKLFSIYAPPHHPYGTVDKKG